jgi:hypothetical protein
MPVLGCGGGANHWVILMVVLMGEFIGIYGLIYKVHT